jgi:CDGSH-type Zn-finger protein
MEKIRLEVYNNGKIRCFGTTLENFELVDQEGKAIPHGNPFILCGCGKSQKKPICDGSHKEV